MKNQELIKAFVRGVTDMHNDTGSMHIETVPIDYDVTVLYSYSTPIAVRVRLGYAKPANIGDFIMTDQKFSVTTTMHKRLLLNALADFYGDYWEATEHMLYVPETTFKKFFELHRMVIGRL